MYIRLLKKHSLEENASAEIIPIFLLFLLALFVLMSRKLFTLLSLIIIKTQRNQNKPQLMH